MGRKARSGGGGWLFRVGRGDDAPDDDDGKAEVKTDGEPVLPVASEGKGVHWA